MLKCHFIVVLVVMVNVFCFAQKNQCINSPEFIGGTRSQFLILNRDSLLKFDQVLQEIEKDDYSLAKNMLSQMIFFFDTFRLNNNIYSDTLNWFCDWKNIEATEATGIWNIYCTKEIKTKLQELYLIVERNKKIKYEDKMRIIRYCLYWSCLAINKDVWFFHPQITTRNAVLDSSPFISNFEERIDSFSIVHNAMLKYHYYPNGTICWHKYPARIHQCSKEMASIQLKESINFKPSQDPVRRKMEIFIMEMLSNIETGKWIVLEFNWFTS